jgi:hypothetical protein
MLRRCSSDRRGDSGDVAGVDHADATVAGGGPEAARSGDRGGRHEEVLHVGVVSQQRVPEPAGDQAVLDLGLVAPPRDGRVGGGLAGDLHDVPDAGADSAGDHVQLLGGECRADENHGRDALHRRVDGRRNPQITDDDLGSGLGERLRFHRVADQDAHRFPFSGEHSRCLRTYFSCCRHEDHRAVSFRLGRGEP